MARRVRSVAVVLALGHGVGPASAWNEHALCTWPALAVLPRIAQAEPVKVERLEDFLAAEAAALERLLATEEEWARAHVPAYPSRPAALAFRADGAAPDALLERFKSAVRINPAARLTPFVQLLPGQAAAARRVLAEAEVTPLRRSQVTRATTFVALRPGDTVAALDVVASASDEPDRGFDVGLWEDSGTAYGRSYGFGKQPFGANPAIEFASQAPLHVGFFHEAAIVYQAAPFLQRTYSEYRIHLWQTLATHALQSGHSYWGWRFAGWALHYIQDLTQPYHARVLPGVSVAGMLWINALDLVGLHTQKEHAIALVTNRHLALENYQLHRVRDAYRRGDSTDAALRALQDTARDAALIYTDASPRHVITPESAVYADALDRMLERHLPPKYTSDPAYVLGETEPDVDLLAVVRRAGPGPEAAMADALSRLLGNLGAHTRAFVRSLPAGPSR